MAVVDLWSGDSKAAVAGFAAAERLAADGAGDGFDPSMCWWRADQIEALLDLGLVEDAVDRLDAWEAEGRRLRRDWVLAHATRCRGLIAASRGDIDEALSFLAEAVMRHEAIGDPFGQARALLALGVVRRRARQKRAAHEAIDAARAGFDAMGAARWAGKAREELGRIGGRTRIEGLTPAERRVAALVAEGRTVASHLTRVYSKLGVRSRTELSRKLG
jgi:DNA-binding CsgD family transcriptional regulator